MPRQRMLTKERIRHIVDALVLDIGRNHDVYRKFLNSDSSFPDARPLSRVINADSITSFGVAIHLGLAPSPDDTTALRVIDFPVSLWINFYPILKSLRGNIDIWSEPFKLSEGEMEPVYYALSQTLDHWLFATAMTLSRGENGENIVEVDLLTAMLQTTLIIRQNLTIIKGNFRHNAASIEQATVSVVNRLRYCMARGEAKILGWEFKVDVLANAGALIQTAVNCCDQRTVTTESDVRADDLPSHWPGVLVAMTPAKAILKNDNDVLVPQLKRTRKVEI